MSSFPSTFSSSRIDLTPSPEELEGAPSFARSLREGWVLRSKGKPRRSLHFLLCLLSLLNLFYFSNRAAAATGRVECNSLPSKLLARSVPYCVVLPGSFDADKTKHFPILYSLHGLGDNEQFFVHSGLWNLVEDLRARGELKDFLIVTPDADASFYINSKDGKNRYEDFLIQEFFPFIEKRYRASPGRANRAISGVSMGGYGALHLALRHPQLFSAVSAHSAALIETLPSFLGGSATSPRGRVLGHVFGAPPDPAFWNQNSPLVLAKTANLAGLKIYFDCGDQDDYGFEVGAAALDKILTSRHIPHEFHLYPGRHDAAYFAEHLPASLAFHSRLFPLGTAAFYPVIRPPISRFRRLDNANRGQGSPRKAGFRSDFQSRVDELPLVFSRFDEVGNHRGSATFQDPRDFPAGLVAAFARRNVVDTKIGKDHIEAPIRKLHLRRVAIDYFCPVLNAFDLGVPQRSLSRVSGKIHQAPEIDPGCLPRPQSLGRCNQQ